MSFLASCRIKLVSRKSILKKLHLGEVNQVDYEEIDEDLLLSETKCENDIAQMQLKR